MSCTDSCCRSYSLPRGEADRSLAGVIEYLILRLVHKKPSPYAAAATGALSDDEPMDEFDDDYLFGLGATAGVTSAMKSALRRYVEWLHDCWRRR